MELSILDEAWKPIYTQIKPEYHFSKTTSLNWGWRDLIKHEDLYKEKLFKDDCLTVLCDVTVTEPPTDDHIEDEVPSPRSMVVEPQTPPPFELCDQLAKGIWNIKNVDVKIEILMVKVNNLKGLILLLGNFTTRF
ncbi:hypothetical protein ACQ4PT_065426 [Festuca glaucescens]